MTRLRGNSLKTVAEATAKGRRRKHVIRTIRVISSRFPIGDDTVSEEKNRVKHFQKWAVYEGYPARNRPSARRGAGVGGVGTVGEKECLPPKKFQSGRKLDRPRHHKRHRIKDTQ